MATPGVRLIVEPPEDPEYVRDGILALLRLGTDGRTSLLARLQRVDGNDDVLVLCRSVAQSKPEFDALMFVWSVVSQASASPEDDAWVEGLVAWGLDQLQDEERSSIDPSAAASSFKTLLRDEHALWRLAKKHRLSQSQSFSVASSHIHTDIRPVFWRDADRPPFAWVIIHTLRVVVNGPEGEVQHVLGFTDASLAELEQTIQRAFQKSRSLTRTLQGVSGPADESA